MVFKKSRILIFSKFKYLHAKIASLATVKSCVTACRSNLLMANVWQCAFAVDELFNLSACTVDTSMITVSSCSVKLLSGLERKTKTLDIHMHFCGFSFTFFPQWGVILSLTAK